MTHRTYENSPVACNLVISSEMNQQGFVPIETRGPIDDPRYHKILDQIGISPFTFVAVDPQLNYLGYRAIKHIDVDESGKACYHPEFLNPFASLLSSPNPYAYSVHLTQRRDLIIMDSIGMLCARRKGKWKAYDPKTFSQAIGWALSSSEKDVRSGIAAANLYEVLFDLSFRRHGALLIYDPDRLVVGHVVNKKCLIGDDQEDGIHKIIGKDIQRMSIGEGGDGLGSRKKMLLELASVDGAVIFDNHQILAFGAIIDPHPNVVDATGARSTAALSAFHWGGKPIKVSSDGEVTLHFKSRRDGSIRTMSFL